MSRNRLPFVLAPICTLAATLGISAGAAPKAEAVQSAGTARQTAPPATDQARRQPVSVLSVLSRHTRGMGGAMVWEDMGLIEMHLTLRYGSGETAREEQAVMIMDGPEQMRWSQKTSGDATIDTVRNGEFTWMEGGPKDNRRFARRSSATAHARFMSANTNNWVAQLGLWFGRMEVAGFVDVDDERCIRLNLQDRLDTLEPDAPANAPYTAYFSEQSGRLVKMSLPPVGRMYDTRTLRFSEWKTFGPVTVATRIDEHIGDNIRTTIIREVRVGDDVKASFDVPDSVRSQPNPDAPVAPRPSPGLGGTTAPPASGEGSTDDAGRRGGSGGVGGVGGTGGTGGTGGGTRDPQR